MGLMDKWLTALQDAQFEDQREDIENALIDVENLITSDPMASKSEMFRVYKKTRLAQLKARRSK